MSKFTNGNSELPPSNADVQHNGNGGSDAVMSPPMHSSDTASRRIDDPSLSSETQSEEDYDENFRPNIISALDSQRQRSNGHKKDIIQHPDGASAQSSSRGGNSTSDSSSSVGLSRNKPASRTNKHQKFKDFVFTRQVSTFDAQSEAAVNSPFHGFYNLFWLSVALLICKISANNWRAYGNLLGPSDILRTMFHRDVIVLLLSDGIMCGLTAVTWCLQKLVLLNIINWDREGWIIQHIWQACFIAGTVKWTVYRDWPWTHTVFFVLHALVMLMKQHSYAFYNGYLSTIHRRRQLLLEKLKKLEFIDCSGDAAVRSASNQSGTSSPTEEHAGIHTILKTIDTSKTLDHTQVYMFERVLKEEVDTLGDELRGTSSRPSRAYPHNLTFLKHYQWIPLPTVVYELEYPRLERINWAYVAEKLAAMIGIIFVMIQVSQHYIYPVVLVTIEMRENNMPLAARFNEFPWLLGDLLFPFMMEYLLTWYLIWETVLNILAELTYFADRHFYDAWWNSVSWDQFARDWNRPVHIFLLRHVYHSSISSLKVNKHTATIITFFLSACVHEFIMWCIFKRLRGYLLVLQMCQLPLMSILG
ncbi:hypothetical protein NLG97_g4967 [Lecanicillium saksenae]|uniref:Uncharacterized protein n=1 Tax=Lecanicillium saksenae TaxID=468837 RepID=A0ACC1QXM8_9HYPO|nr:hypothetical protein NLG97_g4967 [Lecanicillium saksenae]